MTQQITLSPTDQAEFKGALQEINEHFMQIAEHKDIIKEIVADVAQKYGMDKKMVNKIARTFYKQNFSDTVKDNEKFESVYEAVVVGTRKED